MDYSRSSNIKARREHASSQKKLQNKIGIIIFRVIIAIVLVGGFATMGAGVGLYLGIIENAPPVEVTIRPNIYTSIIYDSTGTTEIDRLRGEENRIYVTSARIPKNLKNAFVAIEDERFYQHDGIDIQGIMRAAVTMVETRFARTEGASTITQQLIKNNVNKLSYNTVTTKLQEQFMAVQFERELQKPENYKTKEAAKDHILEVYINTINLGHGYYGAQTAAKNYFNKDVSDLTLSECAVLASITQNPARYRPDTKPDQNRIRQEMVLDKMLELQMISQEEYDEAWNDNVYERISETEAFIEENTSVHSYFIDALVSQLSEDIQTKYKCGAAEASNIIYNNGLKIFATQDDRIQKIVDNAMLDDSYYPPELFEIDIQYLLSVTNSITGKETNYSRKKTVGSVEQVQPQIDEWKSEILKPNEKYSERIFIIPQPQVGMAIMDYFTGQVKAIAGGRGNKTDNRTFNRAVDAVRQPGSVFKILASYAPALELGLIGPSSIIVDEPFSYQGHDFNNWWGASYKGPQTVRAGIEQSMNILAVKNMVNTGIEESYKILERFHIKTLEPGAYINGGFYTDKSPSTALGGITHGITPLDMTAAFGAIANNGFYNKPIFYTKVLDHDGNEIINNEPQPEEILKKGTAYFLTDMMRGVITAPAGTGRRAAFRNINIPIAGKTGTTSDSKDLTFVGYTPYYVAGIWTGYDQPREMETGNQGFHLELWRDIMEEIHKDFEYKDFDMPSNVEMVYICQDSGKLASDFCWNDARGSRAKETPLLAGGSPSGYCDLHGIITIDTSTGMKATANCPEYNTRTIVGIVVRDENLFDDSYQIPSSIYHGATCTAHPQWVAPQPVYTATEDQPVYQETPNESQEGPQQEWPSDNQYAEQQPWPEEVPPDQHFSPDSSEDSTPSRSIFSSDEENYTIEVPYTEWIEPEPNPPQEDYVPIEDYHFPEVDEPSTLDDFIP